MPTPYNRRMEHLGIGEVAELTGIAVGTLRMWETRYGFPVPTRTASGHRRYATEDVEVLRSALSLKEHGFSVAAALARAQTEQRRMQAPSLYRAIVKRNGGNLPARRLKKRTLVEVSRAIEDEALSRGTAPVCFGAFQEERFYRRVEPRWRKLGAVADAAAVFADFPQVRIESGVPAELPIVPAAPLGNEWSVVIDSPGFSALLVAWERDEGDDEVADMDRCFESYWTLDPVEVRAAARVGAALARDADEAFGDRVDRLLADRPLAFERPPVVLTALTNRLVAYLEG